MQAIWLLVAEVSVDCKVGFINITTWAGSREQATEKIERYLQTIGWHLISIERVDVLEEQSDEQCGEHLAEMIARTRMSPDAIILGTFHTYKSN